MLDARRPAARQMATALEEYRGLNAVHVIAHGAPGRVRFAAGEWSAETLEDEAGISRRSVTHWGLTAICCCGVATQVKERAGEL